MNPHVAQHQAELEQYRKAKAYYASIRRPRLEGVTFSLALVASVAASIRIAGWGLVGYGEWLAIFYIVATVAFVGLDSIFAPAIHPVPLPLGGLNPSRLYEKFAMQERSWQLLLVLMLPAAARLYAAFTFNASIPQ